MKTTLCTWVAFFLMIGITPWLAAEERTKLSPLATTGPKPRPVETPSAEALDASIRRGVEFLLDRQNKNGSWGSPTRTKGLNIYAPVPGSHHAYRSATTALCISALVEVGGDDPKVVESIDRAEAWTFKHLPHVRRATPEVFYNTWSHAYGIQALVRMMKRHEGDPAMQEKIRPLIEQQIEMLGRYECVNGGWAYYDFDHHTQRPGGSTISFVTATALVAFDEARQAGFEIPERLITRAKASILRQRKADFCYCYGEYTKMRPMRGINGTAGSLGRSQACNVAMRLWGDKLVTDEVLTTWLDRLFARNGWLGIGRKRPIPHESWAQVAGYFYYYGHYYAALCIDQLPVAQRGPHQDQLAQVLMPLQEKDGSWWDYPLYDYHQQYGTAFALMSLGRCTDR